MRGNSGTLLAPRACLKLPKKPDSAASASIVPSANQVHCRAGGSAPGASCPALFESAFLQNAEESFQASIEGSKKGRHWDGGLSICRAYDACAARFAQPGLRMNLND